MAREVRLWTWLRDGLKGKKGLHMRRVENLVSTGDPDVDGCYNGKYFELELKGCDRPAQGGMLNFEVRPAQVVWHRRRWRAGGNIWLYIRVGKGAEVRRYLIPGCLTGWVFQGVTEDQLAEVTMLALDHSPHELLNRASTRAQVGDWVDSLINAGVLPRTGKP